MTPGRPDEAWAPPPAAAAPPVAGGQLTIPGYADFRPLARGGSSDVYSAVQVTTRRPVAVKVVHLRDAEAVRHFGRELELTVRLGRQHPNIVTVLDTATTADGLPCLVMELADLGSVDARLRELGPLPVGDVVALGTVIADALAFAHQQGVLHRDVKPPNILVLPTSYVLTDFGIARTLDAGHSASMELFSYRHAAPQVLDGDLPVAADDVYSLGSTMFTLLAGRAPFAGATPEEDSALAYLKRARTTPAPPLARSDVPSSLAELLARCLARDRADRPSAAELHRLLSAVPTEQRGWVDAAAPLPAPAQPMSELPAPAQPMSELPAPAQPMSEQPAPAPSTPAPPTPAPASVQADPEPVVASEPAPVAALPPQREAALAATAAFFDLPEPTASPEQTVGMRADPPQAVEPPTRRRHAWVPWVVALTLLVAGAVAVVATRTGGSRNAVASPTVTRTPAARPTTAPATPAVTPAAVIAPKLISAKHVGSQVRLHWTDPSGGVDTFVVVQLFDGTNQAFPATVRGITQLTVTPHAASPACFQVVALSGHAQAASQSLCLS